MSQGASLSLAPIPYVPYLHYMNDSIPEGVSLEQLKALAENAKVEDALREVLDDEPKKGNGPYDGLTKGQLIDAANEFVDAAIKKVKDPMIHKIMMLDILSRMIEWHKDCANERRNDGEAECADAWQRDAGNLQAAGILISHVTLGDDDFMANA